MFTIFLVINDSAVHAIVNVQDGKKICLRRLRKSGIVHIVPLSLNLQARQDIVLQTKNRYVYCRTCDLSSQKSIMQFVERFKSGKLLFVFAHVFC